MGQSIRSRIVYEVPETAKRLRQLALDHDLTIDGVYDLRDGDALADLDGVAILLLEQREPIDMVEARVFSIAGANPDLVIAVIVPAPRLGADGPLLRAGALDVLEDGPNLSAALEHTLAAARRVVQLQQERAQLNSELAHQDKLSALGVLAAGVSHEINNPCAAILSNMNVLRDQLESLQSRPRFQRIDMLDTVASDWIESIGDCISASNRIREIVKTLNVFSRKSETSPPAAVDINEEIQTVMRLIGKEVRFQAEFDVSLNPDIPLIMAQPNSITQIVTNLVVNALQALEHSNGAPPRVWIKTDFDDDHVLLEVADNGPGIQPDVLSRIFDPFFTTKPVGKGTGLGLAITRQLVQKVGGEIFAESEVGNGARFSVVIERGELTVAVLNSDQRMPPASDRLRVLLLDDDELILRSLQRSLSPHFECQAMGKAQAALDMLVHDGDFDAVISDVVMPEMNGLEFWNELEHSRPELALRTVFISGGITSDQLRVRVTDTGRPCLSKPVDMPELIRTIRRVGRPFEELHHR